jgi:V/A-type H+-transporting ATPase subunit E
VNQVEALELAILTRAERLADEYRERARHKRDRILRESAERLRLREQREEAIAKSLGERSFRQRVQASELKMQSNLDQVRWNLVTDIQQRLYERMEIFRQDETAYLDTLKSYLSHAAGQIEVENLIAELNARDRRLLEERWEQISIEVAPEKSIVLASEPIETLGGVRVSSRDERIRVDHTFEGRLERLGDRIQQVILERMLPGGLESGNLFGG